MRSGRGRDGGWLHIGTGGAPTAILGRNALTAYFDPAVGIASGPRVGTVLVAPDTRDSITPT